MTFSENKISPEEILKFYKGCESYGIMNHGLLLSRGGETLFEHYVYPYSPEMPHTLFSVTKSLVSTAVGFAIDENLITLETRIYKYFPEYIQSSGTEKITVRDLLTMHSGKKFSFLQDMTGDYVEIFMKSGFRKEKGFLYSNNDAHVLSALLQKITGMPVVDYLMPRLFEPLGIDRPEWETDCKGVCVGGTGAYLTLRSLVKIVQCYVDGGKYLGKQVIPVFWTKEATAKQTDINPGAPSGNGYGYLFWTYPGSFCMNGLYGQLVFGYPDSGAVIGCTNCTVDDVPLINLMQKHLVPALKEAGTQEGEARLKQYLSGLDEKTVKNSARGCVPTGVFRMKGLSKHISELFFPPRLIPRSISSSMAKRPEKAFDLFSFSQSENEVIITWFEGSDCVSVKCGLDGKPRFSDCCIKGYHYRLLSYGHWENGSLKVRLLPINTLSSLDMTFRFENDSFALKVSESPDFTEFILHNITQVKLLEKCSVLKCAASGVMKLLLRTTGAEMIFYRI